MFPALDKRGELFSLLIAECHDVLLHCVLFAGHESAPSLVTGTSIQRTHAKSMTETTRSCRSRNSGSLVYRPACTPAFARTPLAVRDRWHSASIEPGLAF